MTTEPLRIFVGYDSREDIAYEACRNSILRRSTVPVQITPLKQQALRRAGLYRRAPKDFTKEDSFDGKPFSTEFSFTRFLVPALMQWEGWVLFCDCDFLFRDDVSKLFALRDDRYAVMCVKHTHTPSESLKMDGMKQERYYRKNWSSCMLFNCGHVKNKHLTVDTVNNEPGSFLHGLCWLADDEIGELPLEWNYLVGYNTKEQCPDPKVVHFTRGIPAMDGYADCEYANEWWAELDLLNQPLEIKWKRA